MPCASSLMEEPQSIASFWRQSGQDFDLEGRKSTLKELLQIGGFFPLGKVEDRLPFSASTLRRWAKLEAFDSCLLQVKSMSQGRTLVTLIDLNRLDECLQILAENDQS